MSKFKTDYVDVRIHRYKKNGNIMATTLAPLVYERNDETTYIVPEGFETNFASTPKLIWNLFPPIDKWTNASILHDWLYEGHGVANRKEADKVFKQACKDSCVNGFSAWLMWLFVRAFAWFAYTSPNGKSGKIDCAGIIAIIVCICIVLGIAGGITAACLL